MLTTIIKQKLTHKVLAKSSQSFKYLILFFARLIYSAKLPIVGAKKNPAFAGFFKNN